MSDGPSPVIRAILLSIGATATAYRVFNDFLIALLVGCVLGVVAAVALDADARRRAEERWYREEARKQEQRARAEQAEQQ